MTEQQVMPSLEEAARMALEALEKIERTVYHVETPPVESLEEQMRRIASKAITALRQALANQALDKKAENARELGLDYEVPTLLPDGSAFGVMSFPLPSDHWLYAPNEYRDGEDEPIDLPKPILTHAMRDAVVAAVRYAIRGATMRGQENDFDPDALVQNAVYALCGPYGKALEQQPADEPWEKFCDSNCVWTDHHPDCKLAKDEPVVDMAEPSGGLEGGPEEDQIEEAYWRFDARHKGYGHWKTAPMSNRDAFKAEMRIALASQKKRPQPSTWVGLTDEEIDELAHTMVKCNKSVNWLARAIEAKLKEKNL